MKLFKKIKSFFERNFSFEHGVDLNDEVEVLFRRNIVIKNIILISNMVYSADSSCVDTVICDGNILMQNRVIPGEKEIIRQARQEARRLVKR